MVDPAQGLLDCSTLALVGITSVQENTRLVVGTSATEYVGVVFRVVGRLRRLLHPKHDGVLLNSLPGRRRSHT